MPGHAAPQLAGRPIPVPGMRRRTRPDPTFRPETGFRRSYGALTASRQPPGCSGTGVLRGSQARRRVARQAGSCVRAGGSRLSRISPTTPATIAASATLNTYQDQRAGMQVDEIEHRAVGGPVDGVAERAADDQPEGRRRAGATAARRIQTPRPRAAASDRPPGASGRARPPAGTGRRRRPGSRPRRSRRTGPSRQGWVSTRSVPK